MLNALAYCVMFCSVLSLISAVAYHYSTTDYEKVVEGDVRWDIVFFWQLAGICALTYKIYGL